MSSCTIGFAPRRSAVHVDCILFHSPSNLPHFSNKIPQWLNTVSVMQDKLKRCASEKTYKIRIKLRFDSNYHNIISEEVVVVANLSKSPRIFVVSVLGIGWLVTIAGRPRDWRSEWSSCRRRWSDRKIKQEPWSWKPTSTQRQNQLTPNLYPPPCPAPLSDDSCCAHLTRLNYPTPPTSAVRVVFAWSQMIWVQGSPGVNCCCSSKANRAARVEFFASYALEVVDLAKRWLSAAAALPPPPAPAPALPQLQLLWRRCWLRLESKQQIKSTET